jgi:putative PEP-CTERM system histidine kinase
MMDSKMAMVAVWSYGLAGVLAALLTLYLAAGWRAGGRSRAMFLAVSLCALWGMLGLAFALTGQVLFLAGSLLADMLRFGGWYLFLLVLMKPEPAEGASSPAATGWLSGFALLLVVGGFAAQVMVVFGVDLVLSSQRVALFVSLAMSVYGLVLVERLFRNVSPDFRWSIKPLCLGLGGVFLFDMYLYSDALLFNRIDADAFSIRGFAHAMGLPLVALSAIRSHDWKRRLVMSQRAALHSATLLIVGTYLLFMAAAGYYVRFFGGEWGRALQMALLFAALLVLAALTFSGSMRSRLRVQVGKHFFSYRYDYREEWLRFTQTLSAQGGFTGMGRHVVRGLADMVESPSGALWLKDPSGRFFAQAAFWNMPASPATEDVGSPLCRFLLDSGWVINLEEYRSLPRRYDGLELPSWLVEVPNAWLVVPLTTRIAALTRCGCSWITQWLPSGMRSMRRSGTSSSSPSSSTVPSAVSASPQITRVGTRTVNAAGSSDQRGGAGVFRRRRIERRGAVEVQRAGQRTGLRPGGAIERDFLVAQCAVAVRGAAEHLQQALVVVLRQHALGLGRRRKFM